MSDTVQIRPDGFRVVVEHPYTSREGKAATAIVFFATVSLIASLVLIAALSISVWRKRARTASKPLLFINTHATVYFIFLTLSVIIQDVGGIITIEWIRKWEVYTGPICTVQAILKHIGDVSTAIWTLVLAIHSFLTIWQAGRKRPSTIAILGRQFQRERFTRWSTVAFASLVIAILLILGPELTNKDRDDSFYGIAGEWCWITDGYKDARIIFGYFIMFFSAVASFILYVWMFYRVHRNLRILKPASEYILSEKDQDDEYKIKLSKYMIYYPVAYFICILPITVSRFVSWGGLAIPFDIAIFTDTIYQLLGLVNMIIYFFTPRMLPAKTVFPTGLNAEEEEYKRGREDKYANPRHKEEKHFVAGRRPPPLELALPQLLKAPERAHSRGTVPPPMYSATTGRKVTRAAIKQNWHYKRAAAEDATTDRPRPTLEAQLGWHSRHTSVASSVNGLPPQARVNGLPSHPAERLSGTSSTRSSVSSIGALAGRRGIAVGFPVNPSQARSSQSSFESYASRRPRTRSGYPIQLEDGPDGSDTPTTISVPEVAITKYAPSVVSISLDADDLAHSPTSSTASTAIGSGEYSPNSIKRLSLPRLDVDVKTTGRGLEPPSALSSAEPLSGTVFQMVTRPGVYIVGRGM